jgi:hypothetical protein
LRAAVRRRATVAADFVGVAASTSSKSSRRTPGKRRMKTKTKTKTKTKLSRLNQNQLKQAQRPRSRPKKLSARSSSPTFLMTSHTCRKRTVRRKMAKMTTGQVCEHPN